MNDLTGALLVFSDAIDTAKGSTQAFVHAARELNAAKHQMLMTTTEPRSMQPVIYDDHLCPKPTITYDDCFIRAGDRFFPLISPARPPKTTSYDFYSPCTRSERKVKRREKKLERQRKKRGRR